jgi:hypothetical protein
MKYRTTDDVFESCIPKTAYCKDVTAHITYSRSCDELALHAMMRSRNHHIFTMKIHPEHGELHAFVAGYQADFLTVPFTIIS